MWFKTIKGCQCLKWLISLIVPWMVHNNTHSGIPMSTGVIFSGFSPDLMRQKMAGFCPNPFIIYWFCDNFLNNLSCKYIFDKKIIVDFLSEKKAIICFFSFLVLCCIDPSLIYIEKPHMKLRMYSVYCQPMAVGGGQSFIWLSP